MPEPYLNGRRAKAIFILHNEDNKDARRCIDDMISAHVARRDQTFWEAARKAKTYVTNADETSVLLSQGRYPEAERKLGIPEPAPKKAGNRVKK